MARPLRLEFPGTLYHLTARGNAQQAIFLDAMDREAFLTILAGEIDQHRWRCYAYCLMDNHYHLLIETPEANLVHGMRRLNSRYAQRFNRRHRRVGHLFQGRYKSIVVDRERHLLELTRYIVLNPVRAGISDGTTPTSSTARQRHLDGGERCLSSPCRLSAGSILPTGVSGVGVSLAASGESALERGRRVGGDISATRVPNSAGKRTGGGRFGVGAIACDL